jgi:methyl-accepting chemotaxis protein
MFLDNIKISHKIMGLSFGILLLVSFVFGFVSIKSNKKQGQTARESFTGYSQQDVLNYREQMTANHKERIGNLTDAATSSLEEANQKVLSGEITLEKAQDMVKKQIEQMRYDDGKGYFWINSDDLEHPVMIMHPIAKALNGQDIGQYKKDGVIVKADSSETPMFQEMVKVTMSSATGDGYVGYQWPNPANTSEWLPKLSYVKRFEPWGWIIGTGVYIDDIERTVAKKKQGSQDVLVAFGEQTAKQTSNTVKTMIVVLVLLLVVGFTAILIISRNITEPLSLIKEGARRISQGDTTLAGMDGSKIANINVRSDELGEIGRAFSELIQNQQAKAEAAEKIAKGNLDVEVKPACDEDLLGHSMVKMIDSIIALTSDTQVLVVSALEGQLDTRANASTHSGAYAEIVRGINQLLDAMVNPINETAEVLEAAAGKDLTKSVEGSYKGRFADLKTNVNATITALGDSLSQVSEAVEQVGSASGQISSGSQSLAEGANEQASSLEEISSSLEEMSSMTKQNADNANQAKVLSGSARESADKGNGAMARMSDAIEKIKASSDQTAKIVKTIDEIAFQTNLLALNAAVEAARAGEAGKGFAVVAEEVRNLAQRSAEAAKDTADMIEESVKNAEGGVQITQDVAKSLEEIADGSGKVNDLVAEISAAASEQAQGIEQVNTAVAQMDKVTQQNASNSEESASAAEELNSQAVELRSMVAEFKLTRNQAVKTKSEQTTAAEHSSDFQTPGEADGPKEWLNDMESNDIKAGGGSNKKGKAARKGNGNGKKKSKPEAIIPLDAADFGDF